MSVPQGLEDVSSYPTLFAELIGTGKWTIEDLKKLAGLNFLRVFQDVERVRDDFKKAKVPPYEDVMIPRPKVNNCSSQDQFWSMTKRIIQCSLKIRSNFIKETEYLLLTISYSMYGVIKIKNDRKLSHS